LEELAALRLALRNARTELEAAHAEVASLPAPRWTGALL
jgi:hypothetical protein